MVNLRIFVFGLSLLVAVNAQHCTPGIVPNLTLNTTENNLKWTTALNPNNCTINAYIIDIFDSEEGVQLQHQTGASVFFYSLVNLDMCKSYIFEVHALTIQDVIGPSDRINGTIPPAANLNLTLSTPNVTLNDSQLTLSWTQLNSAVGRCISYYRVVYWDENNNPVDVYVTMNNFTLQQIPIACMAYTFQISAIVNNPDIEGPLAEISYDGYTAVPDTPKLVSIVTSNTTANMTWKVPTYSENRCNLTALVVSTLGLPARNTTTRITVYDSPLRPNVDVFLQGLTPNNVYTSYVHLENEVGSSKNVTTTFQTLDSFVFNYDTDLIDE